MVRWLAGLVVGAMLLAPGCVFDRGGLNAVDAPVVDLNGPTFPDASQDLPDLNGDADGQPLDANEDVLPDGPAPDSPPPDAFVCPDACDTCVGGVCEISDKCASGCVCPANIPCKVLCTKSNTCQGKIDCSKATGCNVLCTGNNSCTEAILCGSGPCDIKCDYKACAKDISCGNGPCTIDCTQTDACQGKVDCSTASACTVNCSGNSSCAGAIVCGTGSCGVTCKYEACSGDITCGVGACDIACTSSNSCKKKLDCSKATSCTAQCSGNSSCAGPITCGSGFCDVSCDYQACKGNVDCSPSCGCSVDCGHTSSCAAGYTCPLKCTDCQPVSACGTGC